MSKDALLSTRQVAAQLGVRPKTVQWWVSQRKIDHYRVVGAVRIPQREVDRLLKVGYVPKATIWEG